MIIKKDWLDKYNNESTDYWFYNIERYTEGGALYVEFLLHTGGENAFIHGIEDIIMLKNVLSKCIRDYRKEDNKEELENEEID